jgi:hypothetical protein
MITKDNEDVLLLYSLLFDAIISFQNVQSYLIRDQPVLSRASSYDLAHWTEI